MTELATFIIPLAICVGLIMWAASMFHLTLEVAKVAVSCVASSATTTLILVGLMPSLDKWSSGFPMAGQVLVLCLAVFGTPLLVLAACLAIVANLDSRQAQALALFGWGGVVLAASMTLLLLLDKVPNTVINAELLKNAAWLSAGLGVLLMFFGYTLGTRLKAAVPAPVIPNRGEVVIDQTHIDPLPFRPTEQTAAPRRHQMTEGQNPTVVHSGAVAATAWLVVSIGKEIGKRFDLHSGDLRIGRESICQIRIIGDDEVSRQHALIRVSGQLYELHDTASRGGTFLNDARVTGSRALQDGDEIRVGKSMLTFKRVG